MSGTIFSSGAVAGGGGVGGTVVAGGGGGGGGGAVVAGGGGGPLGLGCGGIEGACFEPGGAVEVNEAWTYAGAGRGQYQQMSNMQYVGGGGDYNKEQVLTYRGYRCRLWCQIFLCLLFLALVGFLIWWFLPRNEREEREIIIPAPPPAPTCHSFQCPSGYVHGGMKGYFDCNAGLSNWAAGWSAQKKVWCCAHEGKGCAGPQAGLSVQTCCQPTCATLHCPHGYHPLASELSATTVSMHTCCKKMPTCGTSFSCPSGYVEYHSHFSATTLSVGECCRPTCSTYHCAHGYLERHSELSATTMSLETCCKKEPACGTSFDCPGGYAPYHTHFRAQVLNVKECCQPTCLTLRCPHGYLGRPDEMQDTMVNVETCCRREPTCGDSFNCPDGYAAYHSHFRALHLTMEECCRPTCASFTCHHGYLERPSMYSDTSVSLETCCRREPACGGSYTCPNGYAPYHSHFRAVHLTMDECCRPTCETYQCAHGYLERTTYLSSITVNRETCCKKEPACGTSYSCPSGYAPYHSHFRAVHLTMEECCRPTCMTLTCPHGYLERPSEFSDTTVDVDTCCKRMPSCGTSYSCPDGYMLYHSHFRAKVLNVQECCKPTCATLTCPHGTTRKPGNFDCAAGLANFEAGWSSPKKDWCCAQEGKGCSGYSPAVDVDTCCQKKPTCETYSSCPIGQVVDPCRSTSMQLTQENCCRPTCATYTCPHGYNLDQTGNYDCTAGLENSALGWSQSKKTWCCAHQGLGCSGCSSMPSVDVDTCCTLATTTPPPSHSCKLWGDPHIITFDKSRLVFYSTGDFWIVKSAQLNIQGRFQCTDWTAANDKTDYSSMTAIIVSGPIIQNHKIEVQTAVGEILCDGRAILPGFGSSQCGGARITYDGQGELVDDAMSFMPHKVVHMILPDGVFLQVNRWPNFMNAKIDLHPMNGGQDGVCGNFNGMSADDTGKELHRRYGHGVDRSELLFSNPIPLHVPTAKPSPKRCSAAKHARAEAICRQEASGTSVGWSFAECMGDVCDAEKAGMNSIQAQEMKAHLQR